MSAKDLAATLRTLPGILAALAPESAARFAAAGEEAHAGAGETLWREGNPATTFAFVLEGSFEVLKETAFPDHPFTVGTYGPGALLGEAAALGAPRHLATVVAASPSKILRLPKEFADTLGREDPAGALAFGRALAVTLGVRLKHSYERMAAIF